ncbi:MAG: hypothetical protein EXR69_06420 [Myxococcales bacterium]|nr:hypothetical protein [Myxococcales bacterium]
MLFLLSTLGCFQENLPELDFVGTVVVPKAAATRTIPTLDETGAVTGSEELTDPRFIGAIFLGAYAGIDNTSFAYPHPSMGPILDPATPGNAFPYGGTSVGRFDFACYDMLACKIVTGRFSDYDDVLEYFRIIGQPVTDFDGNQIADASTFQQQCFYYYHVTSDVELSFIGDADFTVNSDGDFEAEFNMPHTTYYEGMAIWGFMDAPTISATSTATNQTFTTCQTTGSREVPDYNDTTTEGEQVTEALNFPSQSITTGDWVGDGTTFVGSVDAEITVNLSVEYSGD